MYVKNVSQYVLISGCSVLGTFAGSCNKPEVTEYDESEFVAKFSELFTGNGEDVKNVAGAIFVWIHNHNSDKNGNALAATIKKCAIKAKEKVVLIVAQGSSAEKVILGIKATAADIEKGKEYLQLTAEKDASPTVSTGVGTKEDKK